MTVVLQLTADVTPAVFGEQGSRQDGGTIVARPNRSEAIRGSLKDAPKALVAERVLNFVCGASMRRPHDTQTEEAR